MKPATSNAAAATALVVVNRTLTHCRRCQPLPGYAAGRARRLGGDEQLRQVYEVPNSGAFTDPDFRPRHLIAAAARLPVGGRLRLHQPRRAGAPRPRCRAAAVLLPIR